MNKAIALLMAMTAASVMAVGTQVVGYNTVTLENQYTILGINFTAVTNDTLPLSMNEAVKYVEGMSKGNSQTSADQIQIQNASGGYDIYYMSNGKNAKGGTVAGLEGKWAALGTYVPADVSMPTGTAFWFCRNTYDTPLPVTVAGGVSMLDSYDIPISAQYKLIASPYPIDLALNDGLPYVEGMTEGNSQNNADQIQIQNASGGYDIYYMSNGKNAKGGTVEGLEGKWAALGSYVPADASIPVGTGAWLCRKGTLDFDITVTRPYTIE